MKKIDWPGALIVLALVLLILVPIVWNFIHDANH